MYADRQHVRNKPVKVRLNALDNEALNELARVSQKEPAALARELLLEGLRLLEQHNQTSPQ